MEREWVVRIEYLILGQADTHEEFHVLSAETESGARNQAWEYCRIMQRAYKNRIYSVSDIKERD